jgi:hypothetical protein
MRKMTLFKVLVVLVLCVVGLGFYRGWFVLSSQGGSAGDNKVDVNLTVDPDKAKQDARMVEAKARGLTGGAAEETPPGPSENSEDLEDDVNPQNE